MWISNGTTWDCKKPTQDPVAHRATEYNFLRWTLETGLSSAFSLPKTFKSPKTFSLPKTLKSPKTLSLPKTLRSFRRSDSPRHSGAPRRSVPSRHSRAPRHSVFPSHSRAPLTRIAADFKSLLTLRRVRQSLWIQTPPRQLKI